MKHIITVPSRLLRAARLFQAADDIRYYLRGVFLNRNGYVESSNGHIAFRARCEACRELPESLILRIQGSAVGKGDEEARIYLDDSGMGWMTFGKSEGAKDRTDSYGMRVRLNIATIDGKFPDMDNLFAPAEKLDPVSEIGINGDYIAVTGKAAVALGARHPQMIFRFNGENGTIRVHAPASKHHHSMLINPVRL